MKIHQFRLFTVLFTSIVLSLGILSCKETSSGVTNPDKPDDSDDTELIATSIDITPDVLDLDHHGGTGKVTVTVKDQFGEEMTGLSLTWSVEDEQIALVDTDGTVTGIKPGSTLLSVEHDTLSAGVEVNTLLQMNSRCAEAAPFPSQGAVGSNVSFTFDETSMPDQEHPYITTTQKSYDFDGDGDEDILLFVFNTPAPDIEQGGQVLVWRNENGQFNLRTEEVLEPDQVRADATRQFEVADFNNDGILDLFGAQHGWDTHPFPGAPNLLFLSDGSGGITERSAENISPYITDGFSHASASGDVDCDQDIDIVESDLGDELGEQLTTRLLLNDGSANFQQTDGPLPAKMNESFLSADMCDMDRDGDLDLFLGGWPTPGVDRSMILINNGFGEFRLPLETILPPRPYSEGNHIVDATCADVDLDGWNDLVLAATRDYQGSRLVIWRNLADGTGAFEDVTDEWAPNDWPQDWMFRAYVTDFNGDGWPDIYTSGYPHNQQKVFLNTGGNGFDIQPSPKLNGELHIIDANNDGKTDLFTTDHASPTELYISN